MLNKITANRIVSSSVPRWEATLKTLDEGGWGEGGWRGQGLGKSFWARLTRCDVTLRAGASERVAARKRVSRKARCQPVVLRPLARRTPAAPRRPFLASRAIVAMLVRACERAAARKRVSQKARFQPVVLRPLALPTPAAPHRPFFASRAIATPLPSLCETAHLCSQPRLSGNVNRQL